MPAYRVTTEIITEDGSAAKVSFIVESTRDFRPWEWAVERAFGQLAGVQVTGDVSVDQIWPGAGEVS